MAGEESSCGRFRITTHPLFSAYCGPSCRMLVSKDKEYRVQTWLSSASDEQLLRKIKQQLGTKAQGQMGPLWFVRMLMFQCFGVNVFPSCYLNKFVNFGHISVTQTFDLLGPDLVTTEEINKLQNVNWSPDE